MQLKIFSLYDTKAKAYGQPFFSPTTGLAIRNLEDAVSRDKESSLARHPADFVLYEIGDFDDSIGKISGRTEYGNLGSAAQFELKINEKK